MAVGLTKRKALALLFWGAPVLLIHAVDFCMQVWASEHGEGSSMRDLDMVELFSGEGELTRQCRSYGIDCRGFDILKNPLHDLASAEGFCIALTQTLRVKRNGVIWGGNPCSSWVWISDHSTKRRSSLGVMGDEEVPSVALTNCLAARFALLAMIAVIRGLFWCVEQPMSSLLPQCPYMAHVLTNMMPAFIQRTWLGAFQHWCCKPTQLFESWPSLEKLKATLSKQQRRALKDSSDGMYTKKTRPDGSTQVTGGKRLRSSGACPPEFGKKVAKLFLKGHDVPFSAAALAADRQKDLVNAGNYGFEPPLNWIHAKLPQLREFLLHQKAMGRFTPQPGLEL